MFLLTFAWELALLVVAALLVLHGWRTRAAWLARLGSIEVAVVAFTAWALFSAAWSPDMRWYVIGARRLVMGLVALWVATRLPHLASRRWYDAGLIAGTAALASSAVLRSMTQGFTPEVALLRRREVTNLGWGTANYVAGLLLLFAPSLLRLALRGSRTQRVCAWIALALAAQVQFVVASRAALILFLLGMLVLLLRLVRVSRVKVAFAWLAVVAVTFLSPVGLGFVSRLESVREFGSLTIRLWYFREGWHRLLENLPWGLGLWQGYGNPDRLKGIDPHNWWLLVGGDLGVPGLILWAVVLIAIVGRLRVRQADEAGREQMWMLGLTVVLANLHTLVEPTFQGAHYQLLFYWVVAGGLAYVGFTATTSSAKPNASQ
jgi:hypothetical protein